MKTTPQQRISSAESEIAWLTREINSYAFHASELRKRRQQEKDRLARAKAALERAHQRGEVDYGPA